MYAIFDFINDQVIGLKWVNLFVQYFFQLFDINTDSYFGGMAYFFVYDVIKIFILLVSIVFIMAYIQSYFPPERTKAILGKYSGIYANIFAALLGTVTPFCSCSSVPIFIGFTNARIPLGVSFSFLISSPLVDLGAIIVLMSIFGTKIAIAYVVLGLILAVVGGTIIEKMDFEPHLVSSISYKDEISKEGSLVSQNERIYSAKRESIDVFKAIYPYVFLGVGIGAVIHNMIPEFWIEFALGQNKFLSVLLVTVIGIPIYAGIFGTIPIAEALYVKGAGIGTVLSFMMAITALSLPSMIMLKKVLAPKLFVVFISIVSIGIVIIGYLFNLFDFLLK